MAFDTLTGIFGWVVLRTNVCKTVGMVCRPCRADGLQVDEAFTQRITVDVGVFKEKQQERVSCPECGKNLAQGLLVNHRQTQNGVAKGGLGLERDKLYGGDNPRTYRMAFPARAGPRPCPVKGCSGRASARTAMRVHFLHRHVRDTVVILEEEYLPNPQFFLCDILVPWKALNGNHRRTE